VHLGALRYQLGEENNFNSMSGKVSSIWCFDTPDGPAQVRDYYMNPPTQQSLASVNPRAAQWLALYLSVVHDISCDA
jgi:hypothetical protein